MADYEKQYLEYLAEHQRGLKIVKTTSTPSGQVIDWIPLESQGQISSPPPPPKRHEPDGQHPEKFPLSELEHHGVEHGPEGTVPIPRPNFRFANFKVPLERHWVKGPIPLPNEHQLQDAASPRETTEDAEAPTPHWYAPTDQSANVYGSQGTFSAFSPKVADGDFSLIQLAIGRLQGASRPTRKVGDPANDNLQTLEAGWQKYRTIYGDELMHLFTYFTTVAYTPVEKDFVGGYNTSYKGWVQYDRDLYPGCTYSPVSIDGGAQYKMWLVYQLWRGNWWFWCNDRWLGYYPGWMFVGNDDLPMAEDPSTTLADHGDFVSFFGEVYDSGDLTPSSHPTTSDMGSGEFAEKRWTRSAYIHNILYQANTSKEPDGHNDSNTRYVGTRNTYHYDPTRYDLEDHFSDRGSWGSYMWLGGPGFVG